MKNVRSLLKLHLDLGLDLSLFYSAILWKMLLVISDMSVADFHVTRDSCSGAC